VARRTLESRPRRRLRIDNLLIADRQFDRIGLTARRRDAGRYGGNVVLGVEQAGDTLQLRSEFTLRSSFCSSPISG
jgi:hypothetical protein